MLFGEGVNELGAKTTATTRNLGGDLGPSPAKQRFRIPTKIPINNQLLAEFLVSHSENDCRCVILPLQSLTPSFWKHMSAYIGA